MKVKISISLPRELLRTVDQCAKQQRTTRSNFIEAAVLSFMQPLPQDKQSGRDLGIINRHANRLNQKERA